MHALRLVGNCMSQKSCCLHSCHSSSRARLPACPPARLPIRVLFCLLSKQLEAFPLGKRVKQLRQHSNPVVQQQAGRLLQKMRQDVKDACSREAKAKPILAHFRKRPQTSATRDG